MGQLKATAMACLVALLGGTRAWSQQLAVPMTSYELQVFLSGVDPRSGDAYARTTILASAVRCNQIALVAPPMVSNPGGVAWSDPDHQGRECVAADLRAFFLELPVRPEPYLATITATNDAGTSAPSEPSNIFFRNTAPTFLFRNAGTVAPKH